MFVNQALSNTSSFTAFRLWVCSMTEPLSSTSEALEYMTKAGKKFGDIENIMPSLHCAVPSY